MTDLEKPTIEDIDSILLGLPKLIELCQDYIDFCYSEDYHEDNDFKEYIFEKSLQVVYGDNVFDKLNKVNP